MMIYKKLMIFTLVAVPAFFNTTLARAALLANDQSMRNQTEALRSSAGFDQGTKLGNIISDVIQAFLGLLGIIFVILIVTAGYNWMTAGGDEEKVTKAKKMITRAIIGIIIIIAAYAITYFVFSRIRGVDTGPVL